MDSYKDHIYSFYKQQNWLDIIFTSLFLFGTIAVHFAVRNQVYQKAERLKINERGPLPDLIHTYIPLPESAGRHTDYIIRYMISGMLILCIIFYRLDIIFHYLKLYSILKNFRTLTISITILPDISGKGKNSWLNGATNDLMFSGHVMLSTLLERYYVTYFLHDELFWFPSLFNFAIIINTIMTRRHYSIDVIFAWYITYTFFELSHRIISMPPKIDYLK